MVRSRCSEGRLKPSGVFTNDLAKLVEENQYKEFIPSALAETDVFINKAGPEILGQMYTFDDKGGRSICLLPEVTAIAQKAFDEEWSKALPKPVRLFYLSRCYRYERPQKGRYREFWQFGVEYLDDRPESLKAGVEEVKGLLKQCLDGFKLQYTFNDQVKRGLDYYVEDGFEIEVANLGAQRQIAGGGRYSKGVGWAIGVERLMLALQEP